jgi:hypothetical protein
MAKNLTFSSQHDNLRFAQSARPVQLKYFSLTLTTLLAKASYYKLTAWLQSLLTDKDHPVKLFLVKRQTAPQGIL